MTPLGLLVSTWEDGLFAVTAAGRRHELAGQCVRGLARAGDDALAIVDKRQVQRRNARGEWRTVAILDVDAACCTCAGDAIYVGTDNAQVLRIADDGRVQPLQGFDDTPGRESWYAGAALIDGRWLGPPLGVRSIAATCDGATLLANVHVGGIPRSTDGGRTWRPTIAIDHDVHEVVAHPTRPNVVAAATASGLALSRDGGATWEVTAQGLHAPYSSAVAFLGDEILLAASEHHFAERGAVYRRGLAADESLQPLGDEEVGRDGRLPRWTQGIADTGLLSALGDQVAVADRRGNVWWSGNAGGSWSRVADSLPTPSAVLAL